MPLVDEQVLTDFGRQVMASLGCDEDESRCIAEHLVAANLKGHDSHGIGMIPTYVRLAEGGMVTPNQKIHIAKDFGATLTIDGGQGYGQRVGRDAIALGIERARSLGCAIVALRNTSHLGRIGTYGEQTVLAGLASIHFVNVNDHDAFQAVHGGSDARLGTNPFCAAVPRSVAPEPDNWVVLDMATSNIAFGKARVARNKGVDVPENSIIDGEGRPTTDPVRLVDENIGALLPFGGHKGSGLAIMCELMAGGVTGGKTIQPEHPKRGGIINNMLSIIIDPSALDDQSSILREIDAACDWVKASPSAPGHDRVLVPGEPEIISKGERSAHGIPVDEETYRELREAAVQAGVDQGSIARALP